MGSRFLGSSARLPPIRTMLREQVPERATDGQKCSAVSSLSPALSPQSSKRSWSAARAQDIESFGAREPCRLSGRHQYLHVPVLEGTVELLSAKAGRKLLLSGSCPNLRRLRASQGSSQKAGRLQRVGTGPCPCPALMSKPLFLFFLCSPSLGHSSMQNGSDWETVTPKWGWACVPRVPRSVPVL